MSDGEMYGDTQPHGHLKTFPSSCSAYYVPVIPISQGQRLD